MKRIEIRENFIRPPVTMVIGALILTIILSLLLPKTTQAAQGAISTPGKTQILELYGTLPLRFELNQGQTDAQVRYLSRNSGYDLFLTPGEAVMVLHKQQKKQSTGGTVSREAKTDKAEAQTRNVARMRLMGANPKPTITGRDILPGKSHYFIGNDRNRWHTSIPQYARVAYEGVYPGIDLAFYGTNRQLEYDFIVKPGADPNKIMIAFSGMDTLALGMNGDLILQMGGDTIIHRAPRIYQEMNGEKRSIKGHYVLYDGNRAGFHVASYDTKRPLVIDPELTYSTYLGGSNIDEGYGIAVDNNNYAYVTGRTSSLAPSAFPTTVNAVQTTNGGGYDVFVAKFNSTGSSLLYSTYLGGSSTDEGYGIAVDGSYIYVTGRTQSTDFPTTVNAVQDAIGGGAGTDAFVAKFNAAGSSLLYSTYLGGSGLEYGKSIAVNSSENAHVTGYTTSADFPTLGTSYQPVSGGTTDIFVTKINPTGSALVYSTYLGGTSIDEGYGIAVDGNDYAYVTGRTQSTDFPTTVNAVQDAIGGGAGTDAFVAKFNAAGSSLLYSTYLGGTALEYGRGIAVDSSENVYVTGYTTSGDFPTQNPYQPVSSGTTDIFVTKVNATGSALEYSTYLGGASVDEGYGIAVDGNDYAYVTGRTLSSNLPTTVDAVQTTNGSGNDAFITKLNAAGSSLLYSTYLGGTNHDYGQSIAVDSSENVYVTGYTTSGDFPTQNPYQTYVAGSGSNAFVTKSTTTDPPAPPSPPSSGGGCFIDTVFRR